MKMSLASTVIATLWLGVSPLMVSAQVGSADRQSEAVVRTLNAQEVDAFLRKDPKAMANLWSDAFVVTNPLNQFVNRQQVLGMVESGFLIITSYTRAIEYVRVYGDTVIVAGTETVVWGGKMPNAGRTEHLRFTGIWMKQGERWQQVARHANVVSGS